MHTNCPICGVQTHGDPQHATIVIDGNIVCQDSYCQRQAVNILQTREKCLQLGMERPPDEFQLPLRLDPG